jgi:polysaccharide deacetylase family protein (PEP-CTERM system associated)
MINALSFDLEEYFHAEVFSGVVRPEEWPSLESRVVTSTERLLGVLDEAETSATFFVLGWIAERHPALVRTIRDRGHEVACHGHDHRMITRLTPAQFLADVRRARVVIEDAAGMAVAGYRAPTFSVVRETLWSLKMLAEAGFRYDSSIFPITHDRYGIPDAPRFPHRVAFGPSLELVEFPLSTVRLLGARVPVAGGGYFRLLPYWFTHWAIRHLNQVEGKPAIMYLHPWEIDPDQPRLPVGRLANLRHTVNVGSTESKLRRLLRDFRFAPVRDVLLASGALAPAGGAA